MKARWLGIVLSVIGLIACGDKGGSGSGSSSNGRVQIIDANTNMVDVASGAVLVLRGDLQWMNPKLAQGEPSEDRARYAEGIQISFSSAYNFERKRGLFCTFVLRKIPTFSRGSLLTSGEKIKLSTPKIESYGVVFQMKHPVVEALIVSLTSATVGDVEKLCFANILALKAAL